MQNKKKDVAKNNDWKSRLGMVYSTNPDYVYEEDTLPETETLPKARQRLRVRMEKAGRKGKTVTLVTGFVGTEEDLKVLSRYLKTKLSTGGSTKDGEIVIQGDVREQVVALLRADGYMDVK
ncbi:MAG TPA: translation initiation factor [Alloprevotella sp.]|nr:translation initiation factor [Alloprevotella sp.]